MITLNTGCSRTLLCSIDNVKSIAYDGCDYAALRQHRSEIARLNENLCAFETYRCTHAYSCICFDIKECCYYAFTQEHPDRLFCLDLNFNEIRTITMECFQEEVPCAISVHSMYPIIVLLYANELIYWDYSCGQVVNTIGINCNIQVFDVIALPDGYCISYREDDSTYIKVYCATCDDACIYKVPNTFELLAMVLMEACEEQYNIQLLMCSCDTRGTVSLMLHIAYEQDETLPPPCPCPIPQPVEVTCEGGRNEVIHSIALEEAGIAHILNAEGEKLQKAVASDISIEELLMVNESVRKTITQITLLEGQLYAKLESLHCLCVDEEHHESM